MVTAEQQSSKTTEKTETKTQTPQGKAGAAASPRAGANRDGQNPPSL